MTTLDLSIPVQLTLALVPDVVLIAGAMVLLIWAAWRPEGERHQRAVGGASIIVAVITLVVVFAWVPRYEAGPGPIAIDRFRWLMDIIILVGTIFAIALTMDDNRRA